MPKVLDRVRFQYDVYIYTRDEHPPAHVQVWLGEKEAVVEIESLAVREGSDFHSRDLKKIVALIETHQRQLLAVWDSLFSTR